MVAPQDKIKGEPKPLLPGKHVAGTSWIRGDGPEGFGLYEVRWGVYLDAEGFTSLEHSARRLKTEAGHRGA